jgi:hypothetical protein
VTEQAARRGAGEGAEEVTEQAARRGAGEGAEEAAEGAARQGEELMQPPPKGNEGIRELETGAPIRGEMVEQTGLPRQQLDGLEDYARQNDLNMTGRATNPYSRPALEAGDAIPKPLDIKIKTGNDLDVLLGANPANRGQVTLFEPRMPDTRGMSPELVEALNRRHVQRMAEWNKYKDAWTESVNLRGERVMSIKGTERTHRLVDGRIEVLHEGQWRGYAGDFDLVDITRADGTPLSPAEFQRHVDALVERGLIEHGGEVRVMTDIMRNSPHPPGSAEWMKQAREAWDLRNSLENAHLDNGEIIVGIHGTHGLHRGPRIDDALPWRGGFETPSGQLMDGSTFVVESGAVRPLDLGGAAPGTSALMRGMDDE